MESEKLDEKIRYYIQNAKQVKELMDDLKATVIALENCAIIGDKFSKLKRKLNELDEMQNENTAVSGIRQKGYWTENKKFVDFAVLIYYACRGLHEDIERRIDELRKMEENSLDNEDEFLSIHSECEIETSELDMQQVQQSKEEIDNKLKVLEEEKIALREDIEKIKNENQSLKTEIKGMLVEVQNKKVSEDIEKFANVVSYINQSYQILAATIQTENMEFADYKAEFDKFIIELGVKYDELLVDGKKRDNVLKNAKQTRKNIQDLAATLQQTEYTIEQHHRNHIEVLFEMQQRIFETESYAIERSISIKTVVSHFMLHFETQKGFIRLLLQDYFTIEDKLDELHAKEAQIRKSTGQVRQAQKLELEKKIEQLKKKYQQIKSSVETLKANYENEKKNYAEKIKKEHLELTKIENNVRLQNKALHEVQVCLQVYKMEIEYVSTEKAGNETLNLMDEQLAFLFLKHEKQQRSTRPPLTAAKQAELLRRKPSRWDSDISLDQIDTSGMLEIRHNQVFDQSHKRK